MLSSYLKGKRWCCWLMLGDLHEISPDFTLGLKMLNDYWNFCNSIPLRKGINYKNRIKAKMLESA